MFINTTAESKTGRIMRTTSRVVHVRVWAAGLVLGSGLLGAASSPAMGQSFRSLGFLGSGTDRISNAYGVSHDGSVVVGISSTTSLGPNRAFRWTLQGGMQNLGSFSEDGNSGAIATNYDGSIVVGTAFGTEGGRAFRWSVDGMENLGVLPGMVHSGAGAVSDDGSVVVGFSMVAWENYQPRAFRWTRAEGMQDLGTLPGGTYAEPDGISGDGSIIVGMSGSAHGDRAFLWTSAGGMEDLGVLPGGDASYASAISPDGSIVVGEVGFPEHRHLAFRWTRNTGMQELALLPGGQDAWADSVSSNGTVIVGTAYDATYYPRPVAWLPNGEMIQLDRYLSDAGVNLSGWSLEQAFGVSADGSVFCGGGRSPAAPLASEAWVASFTALPGCPADFNADAFVNTQDYFDFLAAFFSGAASADFDGSGTVDSADFFAFLDSFLTGCV